MLVHDVNLKKFAMLVNERPNLSPTSQTCHQHISSQTSVTNIGASLGVRRWRHTSLPCKRCLIKTRCESRIFVKGKQYLIHIRKLVSVVAGTKIDEDEDTQNSHSSCSQGIMTLSSRMKLGIYQSLKPRNAIH